MSRGTKAYIALILAIGSAALVNAGMHWSSDHLVRFLCYLVLIVPASALKVSLPGITGTMSVSYVFLLAGITELGLGQATAIGVVSFTVQSLWRVKRTPRLIQVLFSIANMATVVTATDFIYHARWA